MCFCWSHVRRRFYELAQGGMAPIASEALQSASRCYTSASGRGLKTPLTVDPIIRGLLARLPKPGDLWPEAERMLWLELLVGSFKLIYEDAPDAKAAPAAKEDDPGP